MTAYPLNESQAGFRIILPDPISPGHPLPAGMGDWATGAYFTHSGSLKYHDDDEDPIRFIRGLGV